MLTSKIGFSITVVGSPLLFQTIGLIGKFGDTGVQREVDAVYGHLRALGRKVLVSGQTAETLRGFEDCAVGYRGLSEDCDLVIVIGGDGTLLHAARLLADVNVPILGINLGRLGFLVDISPDEMSRRIEEVLNGAYETENRFLIVAEHRRAGERLASGTALNDVVLHKRDAARMVSFETYVDGRLMNHHRSDGLIVATPTGSTAYALSGGGPLIVPDLKVLELVPICPHTLSDRPIVISADSEVVLRLPKDQQAQVTWDGQELLYIEDGDEIHIRRHPIPLRLLHPVDYDYYEILRAKLGWAGAYPRR